MILRTILRYVLLIGSVVTMGLPALAALPLDVTLKPRPQAYADSCQSYGIALAAASLSASPLPATNANQLRASEKAIREARDSSIDTTTVPPETRTSHSVWKKAIEKASGGKLTAKIRYIPSAEDFYQEIERSTDVSNANALGPVISAILVKTPVLTSVEEVGTSKYPSGHIISVLGLAKGISNPPGLAALNPAVKGGGSPERVNCEFDDGIGDDKYQAFVSIEPTYRLKKFAAGYLFMTIEHK